MKSKFGYHPDMAVAASEDEDMLAHITEVAGFKSGYRLRSKLNKRESNMRGIQQVGLVVFAIAIAAMLVGHDRETRDGIASLQASITSNHVAVVTQLAQHGQALQVLYVNSVSEYADKLLERRIRDLTDDELRVLIQIRKNKDAQEELARRQKAGK